MEILFSLGTTGTPKSIWFYYSSKLAEQIADGSCAIENMDAKYLAEDLIENEPELF